MSLFDGLAYMVQSNTYIASSTLFLTIMSQYIHSFYLIQLSFDSCNSTLHAVDYTDKKDIDSLATTGIDGVSCARYSFHCKFGIADLQKGRVSFPYTLLHQFTASLIFTGTKIWTVLSSPLFL